MRVTEKELTGIDEQTLNELGQIELKVATAYTLADAIREGSGKTSQSYNWGDGEAQACALTAAMVSARDRGFMTFDKHTVA